MAETPASNLITPFEDSRRWRNIVRRPGDIVISTPPKSGTTWMQAIVESLLWPGGDAPASGGVLSPWIDARLPGLAETVAAAESQTHRRFFTTHSPGDCLPFDGKCRYILVYRDGLDALMSWGNHRATMRSAIVQAFNVEAERHGVDSIATQWHGDLDALVEEWLTIGSPVRHLAAWWPRRHASNVLFVHYNDLLADLGAEMRRVASFLDVSIDGAAWDHVVERCRLDAMRSAATAAGRYDTVFDGGADAFFHQGTNGRWRGVLSDSQIERYQSVVVEQLDEDAAAWLAVGSIGYGDRPEHLGQPDATTLDTSAWHPVFSRLGQQRPTNSIDAIADRRVSEAREAGLFDDLALHGKPIPDIDRRRQPGWWANQFVARERNKVTALQIEEELRQAMPALWRLPARSQVETRIRELNDLIDRHNKATTLAPLDRLDPADTLATWHRLRTTS